MFLSYKMTAIFCLILSMILGISSASNWFNFWASLEFNLLMFISLLYFNNMVSVNSMMKYFLIQSVASSLFLMSILMSKNFISFEILNSLTLISMSIKLGLSPFHNWMIHSSEGISWSSLFIMNTTQKILPLYCMSMCFFYYLIIVFWSMTIFISTFFLINQKSLFKFITLSSLSHLCWAILPLMNNNSIWIFYLMIYFIIMFLTWLNFKSISANSIMQITQKKYFNKISLILTILSLAGLPPLIGFFPKILILNATSNFISLLLILIFSSLINTFIYTRVFWKILLFKPINNQITNMMSFNWLLMLNSSLFILLMLFWV